MDAETKKEDMERLGQIYFNLYLAAATNYKPDQAFIYNQKQMEINIQLFGEDSVEVSNNYYLMAQLSIKKGDIP